MGAGKQGPDGRGGPTRIPANLKCPPVSPLPSLPTSSTSDPSADSVPECPPPAPPSYHPSLPETRLPLCPPPPGTKSAWHPGGAGAWGGSEGIHLGGAGLWVSQPQFPHVSIATGDELGRTYPGLLQVPRRADPCPRGARPRGGDR